MATLNRIFNLYSDSLESLLEERVERGLILMPSYKIKQIRESVAFTEVHRL